MAFSDQPLQTRLPRTGAGLSAVVLAEWILVSVHQCGHCFCEH
jgi:hypothetical protein